jgi:hypothetical protein
VTASGPTWPGRRSLINLIPFGVLGLLVFVASLTPAADNDLWWHLAAGREMLARRSFLFVDPFTISAAGRPWIDVHWLFQLAVYGLYQWHGLAALVVAKAILVSAGACVLLAAVQRSARDPAIATPLFVLGMGAAMFFARHLILVRPVVVTLLFLALFLLMLEDFARGAPARRLLWLPLLQIVWVNSQGLFALGPALIAAYAAGGAISVWFTPATPELPARGVRRLAATIGLCLGACLVTPYGTAGLLLPLRLLLRLDPSDSNVFSANIAENVPPWLLERSAPGQMWPFFVALGAAGVSLAVALGRRQLVIGRGVVMALFALLAWLANRNVLLFFWMATPLAVLNLAPALADGLAHLRTRASLVFVRWSTRGSFAAALATLIALLAVAHAQETPIGAPAPFRVPAGAVALIGARLSPTAPPARVFTADHYGGYVTWALYPRARPFIDTRLVLHDADEYAEFLGLLDNPARWDEFARRQRFDHALLPAAFPDRYLGLIQQLAASPDWRLAFTDGTEVLFTSNAVAPNGPAVDLEDPQVVQGLLTDLDRRWPNGAAPGRAARHHLARLLALLGHPVRAREVLATLEPGDLTAALLRARTHLQPGQGDLAQAQAIAADLLAAGHAVPPVFDLLATIALGQGDQATALAHLRRSLAVDPFDAEARGLLEQIEAQQRRVRAGPGNPPE